MAEQKFTTIDEYIQSFPPGIQVLLESIRKTIHTAAPDAVETISYGMPAFRQNGILVYFAAFKNHIGFFPTASGITAFREELAPFKGGKGSVQFPLGRPIPYDIIDRIVRFRVMEDRLKSGK